MAEDDMDEGTQGDPLVNATLSLPGLSAEERQTKLRQVQAIRDAEAALGPARTVARQVDYGASMYASGKADGAREEREALVRYLRELRPAIVAVHDEPTVALVDAIRTDVQAGEHRKEPDHG